MRQHLLRNGRAMVDDAQFNVVAALVRLHQDGLARRAVLARVAHQVGHNLGDAIGVGHQRQAGLDIGFDAQAGVRLPLFLDQSVDQVAQGTRPLFDAQAHAPLQARQVQHL
ncbi:hypothetical protein D3C71_1423670 [compost metagenome]